MSELLPYEQQLQQQWTDIPLPDEDTAWEDMRRRLNDDDDDRGIFFWWRPGCALWGLLLVLLGLGWWMIKPEKRPINKTGDTSNLSVTDTSEQQPVNAPTRKSVGVNKEKNIQEQNNREIETNTLPKGSRNKGDKEPVRLNTAFVQYRSTAKAKNNKRPGNDATISLTKADPFPVKENVTTDHIAEPDTTGIISTTGYPPPAIEQADTAVVMQGNKDSVKKSDSASSAIKKANKKDSAQKKQVFFSTGIALLQQLPVAGQKATPYNSQGRKGSLADYIPSVYVRLHKKDKWFLQAEFRYGAPQYSKELLYQQVSTTDSGTSPRFTTTTAARLKKTFYHQLPLTFNYHVLPNWSVGGGVVWNKFYAAVSDQETIKHDNINQRDSVLFKGIVGIKQDTSGTIANSYFQAVIETQYQWKRFSIGARYAFGLQPYIRFTLPGQGPKKEKNTSIQAFLRFELWRSARK